ncbi:ABC transporter related protein, partial [sediment metagenome]
PDILLLDEPTNNLDRDGIYHLEDFLKNYKKTVLVISHDAEFLNSFTD